MIAESLEHATDMQNGRVQILVEISAQETPKLYLNEQQHQLRVLTGSAKNFRSRHNSRPKIARTQTYDEDFMAYHTTLLRDHQAQREKEYEKQIKAAEENIKVYAEILWEIKSAEILEQQQARKLTNASNGFPDQNQTNCSHNNDLNNNNFVKNCIRFDSTQHNNSTLKRSISTQFSPPIVGSINTSSKQHMNTSPLKRVEYTIIAENTGHNNNQEPVDIQLTAEDGALNLNTSADSERLEICYEVNVENANIITQSCAAPNFSTPLTSNEHQSMIKKRKILAEDHNLPSVGKTYENKEFLISRQQQQPCINNSLPQTPQLQNRNINIEANTSATPTHTLNGSHSLPACEISSDLEDSHISIGPNNTLIPAKIYKNMNWTSASLATRKLLMAVFTRQVLATHSMTGKPSPAFKDQKKPIKAKLDALKVADIIFEVTRKCNVGEKEVRNSITTKCADENKMMRLQMNKQKALREVLMRKSI